MLKLFTCVPLSSDATLLDEPEKDYERVDFDVHQPTYFVKYLGYEDLYKPGLPEIFDTVKSIYKQKKHDLKSLDHCSLTVSKQELSLRDKDSTEDQEKVFALRRILFCGVYKQRQTIFFYNYQFGSKGDQLKCHVILCRDKEDAKSLAKVTGKAFREVQHDVHIEDLESRQLHAKGLSASSIIRGESVSNVETNRTMYYRLNFEGKKLNFSSSTGSTELEIVKSLAAKNKHINKRGSRSVSSQLDLNMECERTESSQDNTQHREDRASTGHDECDGCSSETRKTTTNFINSRQCYCVPNDSADILELGPGYLSTVLGESTTRGRSDSTLCVCSEQSSNKTLTSDASSMIFIEDDCDWARVSRLTETDL